MNFKILTIMFSIGLISIAGIGTPAFATTFTGDIFYTTFAGGPNIHKVSYTYDNTVPSFTLGTPANIGATPGADGIVFNPNNGKLLVGGQGALIHEVTVSPFSFISKPAGVPSCFHVSIDISNTIAWCAGIPGDLGKIPINPFANGAFLNVIGDVSGVDTLAFAAGKVFYTSSISSGLGSFGTIDLVTGVTTNLISPILAHGMVLDPFTGDLILFGGNTINQIDPLNPAVIKSSKIVPGVNFDQGTVDGLGHIFVADNNGKLVFMDYSGSGLVGNAGNFLSMPFLAFNLDDIAPMVGPGSNPPVGGTILPIDTTLLIAGAFTNAVWMVPVLAGAAGTTVFYLKTRKN